jgi:hypothetical protein
MYVQYIVQVGDCGHHSLEWGFSLVVVIVATVHCTGWSGGSGIDFVDGFDSCHCTYMYTVGWRLWPSQHGAFGVGILLGGCDSGHCRLYKLE